VAAGVEEAVLEGVFPVLQAAREKTSRRKTAHLLEKKASFKVRGIM
jgi:hypothetical protein